MSQKGFAPTLILIGILVIGIIAGGVYYFKKTVNKTSPSIPSQVTNQTTLQKPDSINISNWLTKVDNIGGYKLKYPAEMQFDPASGSYILSKSDSKKDDLMTLSITGVGHEDIKVIESPS